MQYHTMRSAFDPCWDLYPETILEVHLAGGALYIDLREPIAPAVTERIAHLGPTPWFGIVTSDNPHGRERSAAENARCRDDLSRDLGESAVFHVRADGMSPDASHREQGYAVWTDRSHARALAVAHGQSAFFWFDGATFWVEGAMVEARARRLPLGERRGAS